MNIAEKKKYPFAIGGVLVFLYGLLFFCIRTAVTIIEELRYDSGFDSFKDVVWLMKGRIFPFSAVLICGSLLLVAVAMLIKKPQLSVAFLFTAAVGPLIWNYDYFGYLFENWFVYNNSFSLSDVVYLMADSLWGLSFILLAIVSLDALKLFKRPVFSYLWFLPAVFAALSVIVYLAIDLRHLIYGVNIFTLLQKTISHFDELIQVIAMFFAGLWFFKCAKIDKINSQVEKQYMEDLQAVADNKTVTDDKIVTDDAPIEPNVADRPEKVCEVVTKKVETITEPCASEEPSTMASDVFKLKQMLDVGLIDRDEFERIKKNMLG